MLEQRSFATFAADIIIAGYDRASLPSLHLRCLILFAAKIDVYIDGEDDHSNYIYRNLPAPVRDNVLKEAEELLSYAWISPAGKNGEEFTAIPNINRVNNVFISDYSLKELIKQTIFCVGEGSTNQIMNSELVHINGDNIEFVALDGHRIAYRKSSLKNSYSEIKVIIPGKTLNEIERILTGDQNKDVSIFFEKNYVLFEIENTIIVSRLVEGTYFDYEKMLTKDYETKIEVNKKDIFNCIDRSTLMLREGEKKPIIFEVRDNFINFCMKTMFGEMNEDLSVNKVGKDIDIAFNPQFLLDTLKVLEDDEINIYMMSPKNPCIIRNEEDTYVYLILPVNFVK